MTTLVEFLPLALVIFALGYIGWRTLRKLRLVILANQIGGHASRPSPDSLLVADQTRVERPKADIQRISRTAARGGWKVIYYTVAGFGLFAVIIIGKEVVPVVWQSITPAPPVFSRAVDGEIERKQTTHDAMERGIQWFGDLSSAEGFDVQLVDPFYATDAGPGLVRLRIAAIHEASFRQADPNRQKEVAKLMAGIWREVHRVRDEAENGVRYGAILTGQDGDEIVRYVLMPGTDRVHR